MRGARSSLPYTPSWHDIQLKEAPGQLYLYLYKFSDNMKQVFRHVTFRESLIIRETGCANKIIVSM
jgi:hypothetical protein